MTRQSHAREESTLKELERLEEQEALRHAAEWRAIEANPDFQKLVAAKRRFILPATVFFIVYYFALPILVGYLPEFMETNVVGKINLAYLFALSQFVMAWGLAYLYVREAGIFDKLAAKIVNSVKGSSR